MGQKIEMSQSFKNMFREPMNRCKPANENVQTDLSHIERYFENNHNSQIVLNTSDINTKSEDGEATALTNVWRYIYNLHKQPEEDKIIRAIRLLAEFIRLKFNDQSTMDQSPSLTTTMLKASLVRPLWSSGE